MNALRCLPLPAPLLAVGLAAALTGCKRDSGPVVAAAPPPPLPAAPAAANPAGGEPGLAPPKGILPPGPQADLGQAAGGNIGVEQRIALGERLVAQEPKNVAAWVALGNDYFDTHQRQKAVDAYAKALDLQPDNPDVITDQGVMYRELGQFDKAVANFAKANKVAPSHIQSLYNLGVVYAYDFHDKARAAEAWNKLIQMAPSSPQAAQAREALGQVGGADMAK